MKNYEKKYNFDIDFNKNKTFNKIMKDININLLNFDPIFKTYKSYFIFFNKQNLKNFDNFFPQKIENNYSIKVETLNPKDIKKIQEDAKSRDQKLKRKIYLNYELAKIFFQNFYSDEFSMSRKASYSLIAFPSITLLGFAILSPSHPILGLILNISIISSILVFFYYFQKDMYNIQLDKSNPIGQKIKMINNEIVLYNPYSKEIIEEEN